MSTSRVSLTERADYISTKFRSSDVVYSGGWVQIGDHQAMFLMDDVSSLIVDGESLLIRYKNGLLQQLKFESAEAAKQIVHKLFRYMSGIV